MTTMHFEEDPTAFRPMKVTASKDIPVGFETEPFTKKWTLDKGRIFQPWPKNKTFHNDYPSAHNLNLRAPIEAGCQYLEYMGQLVIKFFGKDYLGTKLSVAFLGMTYPEDEVTIKGVVREKVAEGDAVRLTLDMSAVNQRGENIMVGTASGLVH